MDDGGRLPLRLGEDDVDEVLGRRHDADLLEVVLHHGDEGEGEGHEDKELDGIGRRRPRAASLSQ